MVNTCKETPSVDITHFPLTSKYLRKLLTLVIKGAHRRPSAYPSHTSSFPPVYLRFTLAFGHFENRIKCIQGHLKQKQHLPKPWPMAGKLSCQTHPTSWPRPSMEWKVQFNRKAALKWVFEIHIKFRGLADSSCTHVLEVSMLLFCKTQRNDNKHQSGSLGRVNY